MENPPPRGWSILVHCIPRRCRTLSSTGFSVVKSSKMTSRHGIASGQESSALPGFVWIGESARTAGEAVWRRERAFGAGAKNRPTREPKVPDVRAPLMRPRRCIVTSPAATRSGSGPVGLRSDGHPIAAGYPPAGARRKGATKKGATRMDGTGVSPTIACNLDALTPAATQCVTCELSSRMRFR